MKNDWGSMKNLLNRAVLTDSFICILITYDNDCCFLKFAHTFKEFYKVITYRQSVFKKRQKALQPLLHQKKSVLRKELTCMLRVANSTPIVDLDSKLNSFRVNLDRRLLLPTPESPINTTVNAKFD